jgi:ankyrin repeat protein
LDVGRLPSTNDVLGNTATNCFSAASESLTRAYALQLKVSATEDDRFDPQERATAVRQMFAAVRRGDWGGVEAALNGGVFLESVDTHQNTPLIVAAQGGHADMVLDLLKSGAKVNACNEDGNTALHFAYGTSGNDRLVDILHAYGADDAAKNQRGKCCYDTLAIE